MNVLSDQHALDVSEDTLSLRIVRGRGVGGGGVEMLLTSCLLECMISRRMGDNCRPRGVLS